MTSTICLNMIVKDEAHVIERCLASVKPFIDCWVIVDTGSSDGTQGVITETMRDLPGELIERPWKGFSHNRTEALTYARDKAEYVFILDADEVLVIDESLQKGTLDQDSYLIRMYSGGVAYWRTLLVSNRLKWRYVGILHEYIDCDEKQTEAELPGLHIERFTDGARSRDPNTYRKDALLLQQGLIDEPDNERYVFYLAQSYRDCGDLEMAVKTYEQRAAMGRWDEEVWYSLYQIAMLKAQLGRELPEVMTAFLDAYRYRPTRTESLYRLAMLFQSKGEYHLANIYLSKAIEIPLPEDRLFVERSIYDFHAALEYAVGAFYVGDDDEAIRVNNLLLGNRTLPGEFFLRVLENRRFSLERRYPQRPATASPPRVLVVVHVDQGGTNLDNCIEVLSRMNDRFQAEETAVKVVVVGSRSIGFEEQVPSDNRFATEVFDDPTSRGVALGTVIDRHCQPEDVVLWIDNGNWPNDENVPQMVAEYFQTHDCWVLIGQHRFAGGEYGVAMPFTDLADFKSERRTAYHPVALAFKAGLWHHVVEQLPRLAQSNSEKELIDSIVAAAGFQHTHFNDQVLVVDAKSYQTDLRRLTSERPASQAICEVENYRPATAPSKLKEAKI